MYIYPNDVLYLSFSWNSATLALYLYFSLYLSLSLSFFVIFMHLGIPQPFPAKAPCHYSRYWKALHVPEKKERIRERNIKRVFVYDLNVFFSFVAFYFCIVISCSFIFGIFTSRCSLAQILVLIAFQHSSISFFIAHSIFFSKTQLFYFSFCSVYFTKTILFQRELRFEIRDKSLAW